MEKEIGHKDFKQLCTSVFEQRAKVDERKALLKEEQEKLDELEAKILATMEELDEDKVHVAGYGLLYTTTRFTVRVPKELADKRQLFEHFRERGIFDEMVSVASPTLNSYYKTEMEAAIAKGDVDFKIPGVGEPTHIKTLSVRKGK